MALRQMVILGYLHKHESIYYWSPLFSVRNHKMQDTIMITILVCVILLCATFLATWWIRDRKRRWIVLDFIDVVVHIFDQEYRNYYALEMLWGDAKRVRVPLTKLKQER